MCFQFYMPCHDLVCPPMFVCDTCRPSTAIPLIVTRPGKVVCHCPTITRPFSPSREGDQPHLLWLYTVIVYFHIIYLSVLLSFLQVYLWSFPDFPSLFSILAFVLSLIPFASYIFVSLDTFL